MDSSNLEAESRLLAEKEDWIRYAAEIVSKRSNIELGIALPCARWASIWMDSFKEKLEEKQPSTIEDIKEILLESRTSSLAQSESVPRYPSGVPALKSIVAAEGAFLLASNPEDTELLIDLLSTRD
jgi:hypothetical protein